MAKKVVRELVAQAKALGMESISIKSGGKHLKLQGVYKGKPVSSAIPGTPSDCRSLKNWLAELKRQLGVSCQGRKGACKNEAAKKSNRARSWRRQPSASRPMPVTGPRPRLADDPWAALAGLLE